MTDATEIPQRVYTPEEIEKQQKMKVEAEAKFAKRIASAAQKEESEQVATKAAAVRKGITAAGKKADISTSDFDTLLAAAGLA